MAAKKLADSPTKLTEFAPLSSDSRPSGSFFSRLFKRSNESTEDQTSGSIQPQFPHSSGNASEKSGSNGTPQKSASREESKESDDQDDLGFAKVEADVATNIPSTPMSAMTQTRNLSSVLKRLSNILDRRSTTPQAYKDSDFKQYWMPDDNCKECYECGDKFNTFRRRHHCRICGQIFCSRCCNQEVPGKIMGYTGYLRVCTYCCKVVLSYAQNYAQNPETSGDLRALSEELKHLANIDSEGHQVAATDLWTPTSRRKHIFDEEQLKRSNSPDISSPGSGRNPFDLTPQSEYSSFDSFQHERKLLTRDSAQLRELWLLMLHPVDGIETQNHRHRLRTYINCFVGSEVVDWLLARDKVASREQAMAIGQAMVDAKWLESVTPNENVFRDEYALYKPGESAPNVRDSSANAANLNESSIMVDEEAEPAWFREIKASSTDASHAPSGSGPSDSPSDAQRTNSIFYVETSQTTDNLEAQKRAKRLKSVPSTGTVSRDLEPWAVGSHVSYVKKANQDASPLPHQDSSIFGMQGITDDLFKKDEFVLSSDSVESHLSEGTNVWQSLDHLRDDNGDRQAFEILRKTHREHLTALTNQLLSKAGLSLKWAETIMNVVAKISLVVRPDVRHEGDDMDIRQYVQIKKLPGGSRSNTGIICGVVCSKNVTHKKMRQTIANPKILLLRAPLVYQRVENKMSSLEPQILQEYEFLRHCVGRIAALKPDVLLVEKAVSRVAQDFILDAGITLVINVKPSVMQRVSRFTQADIVSSIDGLVNKTTLGFCHSFKMLTFNMPEGRQKSLMYFDGCASHLGCTVILRGGPTAELAKVKTILHFMTYVAYHSKLEISFLMDEFAMPPVDNENLLDLGVQSPMSENGTFAEGVEALKKEKETKETEKDSEKEKGNMQKENTGPENVNGQKRDDEGVENKDARKEEQMDAADGNAEEGQSKDSKENQSGKSQREKMKELRKSGEAGANRSSKTEEFLSKCQKRSNSREGKGGTAIEDFSDPLQSYQKNKDESIFSGDTKLIEEKRANVYKFKATLQDVVLSSSPYLSHEVPYLETEAGTLCNLRRYFVQNIYWSEYFDGQVKPRERTSRYSEEDETKKQENEMFFGLNLLPAHRFVKTKITAPVTDSKNQALLADFRATGGRIWLSGGNEAKNEESRRAEMLAKTNLTLPCKGIDCLDPYNHQRIAVLFSSFSYDSANSPNPCVNPWVVSMDFYGRNDIPLGGFLERYCFRENYLCPSESCDIAMVDHIRRFVHENGCITIISKKLDAPLRGHPSNTIYMWQWCRKCKEVTPVSAASVDTWSMSFAKYLELRFHGHMFTRRGCQGHCTHSLHHDHFQYFGYNHIVASFKYSSMQLREVTLPPIVIEIDEQVLPLTNLVDSAKMLSFKGTAVFSTIMEHLHRLKRDAQTTSQVSLLNDYITEVQNNKEFFRTKIDEVQTWLASIAARSCEKNENDLEQILVEVPELYALSDGLSAVKRIIAESVYLWNSRIVECDQQQKKFEKMKSQNQKEQGQRQSKDITDHVMVIDSAATIAANAHARDSDDLEPTKVISDVIAEEPGEADNSDLTSDNSILDKESSTELDNFSSLGGRSVDATATPSGGNVRNSNDNVSNSNTANQEQNTGPTKLQDEPQGQTGQGQGQGRSSPDIWKHQRSKSSGDGRKFSKQVALVHEHSPTDADKSSEKNLNRASMKNIFSSLLSSSEANPVTMPFSAEEHHLLPPGDRIPVIVLDQEPSSIIAYTLSSPEYEMQLQELKSMLQASRESQNSSPMVKRVKKSDAASSSDSLDVTDPGVRKSGSGVLAFFRGDRSPQRVLGTAVGKIDAVRYIPNLDQNSLDDTDDFPYFGPGDTADGSTKSSKSKVQPSTNYHIELQFSDNTAKFYCRVYFAEQFQRLRKLIFPEGEDRYIRSLSNCFNWLARGGKSGSTFCKTQDDRFILKQMSRLEVQSFVEFAPGYFQYVTKAFNEQTPTVLAKILGVYRIGYRNSLTGRELKQDLLVMENLFYKRKITQIFDLKGSVRNRLVNTSGKRIEDLVLLDENLLKSSLDNPMYVRPHSKTVLTMAITNDTSFLSSNLVMDYSLLVGLDEANKELVVGIIDYIRTFTWDKKLEMVVKSTYSQLGGQGKMPTVVSPELYRSRFLEAMDRYFLLVPDRWTGLGKNIDY